MTSEPQESQEAGSRVVWLRRPPSAPDREVDPPRDDREDSAEPEDDYRHRMVTNAVAFAVVVGLIVAGIWMANVMADMRKNQDCVLAGRVGCTPVEAPVNNRF